MNDEIFPGRHINEMKRGIFKSYKCKNGIYKEILSGKN